MSAHTFPGIDLLLDIKVQSPLSKTFEYFKTDAAVCSEMFFIIHHRIQTPIVFILQGLNGAMKSKSSTKPSRSYFNMHVTVNF